VRRYPPLRGDVLLLWKVTARNRRSLTLDLRQDAGRDLLRRLVPRFDVVTLNYRPETLKRWGLDFDDLVQCKPDIVNESDRPAHHVRTHHEDRPCASIATRRWPCRSPR
jgi:crotonobetainyl-CoA:carnitine CoA-transferase CaiB-like acyl-CoA transferase